MCVCLCVCVCVCVCVCECVSMCMYTCCRVSPEQRGVPGRSAPIDSFKQIQNWSQ